MSLSGRAYIVTGGAGTIGGAISRDIIARGGVVMIFDMLEEEAGAAKVKSYDAEKAFYFKTDIVDTEKVDAACQAALKALPQGVKLFGGVHCAAIAPGRQWNHKLKDSIPVMQKLLHVNTFGTFVVDACIADAINSQYPDNGPFAPRVKEERGCIVNISSVVAKPVPARCLTYGSSKTAVLGISQGLSDFLGPYGIRVCTVSPAVVASQLNHAGRLPYFIKEIEASCIFPHRVSEPTEVSAAVSFILENPMLNDMDLRVDGGWRNSSNWGGEKDPRENAIALE
ncbi:hypothetical protein D1P53_002939 [Cryptococcus gattii VGV]|nr:hypothetical protein D1P53_002939 [Cryptococcus gattii VGV]